ncbi:carboxymuconolactone decarboxylase family protein [Parasphingorhabdus halotolerans]|uniref:Carboxymuconolactone decarboxylase family protein n=1 Tax=Parasphingorhabdus halotolerans TaxID=2725558 RepID=A0A6H2DKH8_9SPHN|nr:carboxymuconolactone decarboxylase family protein [Parasphingorhabdus halotolerans]QJB69169.1 carboxymuconolactone decarboxylase family protein [Parasphingorhabdus halotolerans]
MRLDKPRIAPLHDTELNDEHKAMIGDRFAGRPVLNIFRTLMKAPKAFKAFMWWGGYILSKHNDLPAREREIIILRAGFNWKSGYEWAQHVVIGKDAGLTDQEVEQIKTGPDAPGWSQSERAMLQATDDLTSDGFVSDATWARLSDLTEKQKMDLVMTVGQYTQVSMMLNSFGVQLDDGLELDPDLKA